MKKHIAGFFAKLPRFLTTRIGLLLLGFVLTTLCGAIINGMYTNSTWKRDKRFELLKMEFGKHDDLLSDLTKIVGIRTFRLQRVVWYTDAEASPVPDTWQLKDDAKKRLTDRWDEYYQSVVDWNVGYRTYAIKLRILAGDAIADEFFVGEPGSVRKSKRGTLCWHFEQCHEVVSTLKKNAMNSQVDRTQHDLAQRDVDDLYNKVDEFVFHLYRALGEKEHSSDPIESRLSQR
jgi:hypothetical protein